MLESLNWIDFTWGGLIFSIILALFIERLVRKKQRIIKKTIKKVPLSAIDWKLFADLAHKRQMKESNFVAEILKNYLAERAK